MMNPIKLLVVDDHPLMREAIRLAVEPESDLIVIGEAADGAEGLRLAQENKPDVIILDLMMPGMDGLTAIPQILAIDPHLKILVVTSMDNEERVLAAVRSGALGYFPKTSARADLLEAIRNVAQGTPYLPPEIALKLMNSLRSHPALAPAATPVDSITGRQKEILDLLAQGQSDADISQKLHLEESTVRSHIYHMLQRLELETRAQLVTYAYQSRKTR